MSLCAAVIDAEEEFNKDVAQYHVKEKDIENPNICPNS